MSASSRSSREQAVATPRRRSSSVPVPSRHFVFVVTNHPDFRQLTSSARASDGTPLVQARASFQEPLSNDRETLLRQLLRIEMEEAARHYLRQTHRTSPMQYVFLMSDVARSQE